MLLRLWWFESTHTHLKFGSVAQNGQSGSKQTMGLLSVENLKYGLVFLRKN